MNAVDTVLAAASDQDPQDVGTAGPLGLALILVLLVAIAFLGRSLGTHLKRIPRSFEPEGPPVVVPDDARELFEEKPAGEDLLDQLRRAPRAIEGPREADPDPDEGPRAS